MCEIERVLRRGASTPYTKYKERLGGCVLKIQQTLETYYTLGSAPHSAYSGVGKPNPPATAINSHDRAATSAFGGGVSSSLPSSTFYETDYPRNIAACERLIRRAFLPHEFTSLMGAILLSKSEGETIRSLPPDDAQTLIDVIDEAGFMSAFIVDSLVETDIDTPCVSGSEYPRAFASDKKELH